jgi:hypothetical protein
MNWLICIDEEGVQCQLILGKDLDKAQKEASVLKNRAKCLFKPHERLLYVFKKGFDPIEKWPPDKNVSWSTSDEEREWEKEFKEFYHDMQSKLSKKYGAATGAEKHGYDIRKSTLRNYIEIVASLDNANTYEEFYKNYPGLEGALELLQSATKLMHPHAEDSRDASEKIVRWMKKLQNEIDLKEND